MSKRTLNPHFLRAIIVAVLAVLLALFCAFLFSGCSSIEKAKQTVLTNPQAFDEIGRKYVFIHPCANDSSFQFIKGGIDSSTYQGYIDYINGIRTDDQGQGIKETDSAFTKSDLVLRGYSPSEFFYRNDTGSVNDNGMYLHIADHNVYPVVTMYQNGKVTVRKSDGKERDYFPVEEIANAYKAGWSNGVKSARPDTLKYTVKDKQREQLDLMEREILRESNSAKDAEIAVLNKQITKLEASVSRWTWKFIGSCILGVLGIVGVGFIRFKRKISI